jgi:hypothetical protein
VEAPSYGGSDPGSSAARRRAGIAEDPPFPEAALGIGENRVVRERDGRYSIEFSERSRWTRSHVEGRLKIRPLAAGSAVIPVTDGFGPTHEGALEWQILASRSDVTGTIHWIILCRRSHTLGSGPRHARSKLGCLPLESQHGPLDLGTFPGNERTIIYYRIDPRALATARWASSPGGSQRRLLVKAGDRTRLVRRNRWGAASLEVRGSGNGLRWHAQVVRVVDRGPFICGA